LKRNIRAHPIQGLEYGISIDDEPPQIINLHSEYSNHDWEQWVANNILIKSSWHHVGKAGMHILKFWMVDPGFVLQKFVVGLHDPNPSYHGPPETRVK
jgi:glycosyl hydrolase family 115